MDGMSELAIGLMLAFWSGFIVALIMEIWGNHK